MLRLIKKSQIDTRQRGAFATTTVPAPGSILNQALQNVLVATNVNEETGSPNSSPSKRPTSNFAQKQQQHPKEKSNSLKRKSERVPSGNDRMQQQQQT